MGLEIRDKVNRLLDWFGIASFVNDLVNRLRYWGNFPLVIRNWRAVKAGAPDGLPYPPAQLVYLVTGQYDVEAFYQNGIWGKEWILEMLQKNGLNIKNFHRILDFGCGCGRVIRHWQDLTATEVYGTDYNKALIKWCRNNLKFCSFKVNSPLPPLEFPDNFFDFIYAISVFTHLTEPLQKVWISELKRVLKTHGYLIITVHGENFLHCLPTDKQAEFKAGNLVVIRSQYSGENYCAAFHPEAYVKRVSEKGWKIIDYLPKGAKDAGQDAYLLQKLSKDNL